MNPEAKTWIKHKAEDEIMGYCFAVSNLCAHNYDPYFIDRNYHVTEKGISDRHILVNKELEKISFILKNLIEYNYDLVEDFFNRVDTHWNNIEKYPNYKNYINLALAMSRNEKLSDILE